MAQSNWSAEDCNRGGHESQLDRERRIKQAKNPARAARVVREKRRV